MEESTKITRLSKVAREFNIGISTIVDFLSDKGYKIDGKPNTKLSSEMYEILLHEFQSDKQVKEVSKQIGLEYSHHESVSIEYNNKSEKDIEEEPIRDDFIIKDTQASFAPDERVIRESPPVKEEKIAAEISSNDIEIIKETPEQIKEPVQKAVVEEEKEEVITKKSVPIKEATEQEHTDGEIKVLGKIDLDSINTKTKPARKSKKQKAKEAAEKAQAISDAKEKTRAKKHSTQVQTSAKKVTEITIKKKAKIPEVKKPVTDDLQKKKEENNFIPTKIKKLSGPKILDKIILPEKKKVEKKPVASSKEEKIEPKKKRRRIKKQTTTSNQTQWSGQHKDQHKQNQKNKHHKGKSPRFQPKPELTQEDIQKQIKDTLARLSSPGKSKASKHRRQKRETVSQNIQNQISKDKAEKNIIKVTEFVTANELANMMDVQVNEIISICMSLGMFVSINQRLDAETLSLVAEEFGYKVEFVSVDVQEAILESEEEDVPENLESRAPIVTVMGHVDHGKTLLLDNIRKSNVIAGEAGGITQHIGAYEVKLENGQKITFLDTPGHEAFTAMRARGAQVTDVAIIIVAADDNVMPQTKEAINHAQAAGVPIVFALNKIDKPTANPDKIREELSQMNILVEEWGGKYQCQEISAKAGTNIDSLLDKVLLEAEMLELKGNPNKLASGTIIESSLDKGRGYVAKLLVQNGTIKIGDYILAGATSGKVKAMYNERNQLMKKAGPSSPVLLLGLNGAPQAGDGFNIMRDEREAKSIANKRQQLQREQGIRTQKHVTLDEIGRRIAIGDFKELNVIVKGDVDGSVEALSDSLIKLSTDEIQVNVIHKSVGAVTESDVSLASASNAVIIGFQVRPSVGARKLAETEQIDIRLYSIIYQAIEELKSAIEGMLSPDIEEKIVCNIEIREVFKITKVGTIAGCMVLDGKVNRNTNVRVIRDGIVVYTGKLGSLKRFKDDVKEVQSGYECGLNIENFNDIKEGDIIEGYEQIEIRRKL
jgi:translation initiation factor IF-2